MPITPTELTVIRSRPSYVAALYLSRLGVVPLILFCRAASGGTPDRALLFGTWMTGMVMMAGGLLLLRHAGVPFLPGGLSRRGRDRDGDQAMVRAIYVDLLVLWWPRRARPATQD
ncbi:hypothetical protein [Catellatospora tritici]|uniref:hypothetical protein n=1 Tax=Catellatospora tritici TaxID=2851566 RepID=UPI001C2D9CF9|nr:hypothetical protein [Catellatospora tritici]MBV1851235.1 hypothetical protein [Catellatospora tritici]